MKNKILTENDQYKAIISVPGWVEWLESGGGKKVIDAPSAYLYVPLVRRAVNLRVNSIKSAPWHLEKGGKILEDGKWPVDFQSIRKETFSSAIGKTEAALSMTGVCLWKKRNDLTTKTRAVQLLNPTVCVPDFDEDTQMLSYVYKGVERLSLDDVVEFVRYNPTSDVELGGSEGQAALAQAKLMYFMGEFAGAFFEHGAMPTTIVGVPQGTSLDERDRLETWFQRRMQGIKNAWKALAVRTGDGGVTVTTLTQNIKDMATPELYEQAVKSVADAFEIPHSLLDDAANYATAQENRTMFWHDVMRPEGDSLADTINDQLLEQYGYKLVFDWDTMDQFQEDEQERGTAYNLYVQAKMPPSIAAEMLGLELPADRTYQELDEWYMKEVEANRAAYAPNGDEVQDDDQQFEEEVAKWRRRVLKRLKSGKSANAERSFESEIIPALLIASIEAQLDGADEKRANMIFDNVKEWKGYP